MRARWLATLLAASLATGCARSEPTTGVASLQAVHLTILAAASLKDALQEAGSAYSATHRGTTLTFAFDASSALRAKIEQGAPADLFAAADVANPRTLVEDGFANGPPTPFAANRLAIVVPVSNPGRIATPADLARSGIRLVAAGDAVPISTYARQLVANLAEQPGYPADYATRVAANVVSKEDNASAVVAKVALGEGDAAIVYATDAASVGLKAIPVPDRANVEVTCAAVVVRGSGRSDAAARFLAWLVSPPGQAILARFGFRHPS